MVYIWGVNMKKLVIFGFEGTLADTSPGVLYCLNRTALTMGYAPVDRDALYGVMDEHLKYALKKLYNMKDDEIDYAVSYYSKLYSLKGKEMFMFYDGTVDMLKKLKENGCKLAVATKKHRMFAGDMLQLYKTADLFDAVCATDVHTHLEKSDLLLRACEQTGVSVEDSIFIGDSSADAEGASFIGMDFAAVLYGWGFKTKEDAEKYNTSICFKSASEICAGLLHIN
jgi:phosphoglycolate phosphatase